MSGDPFPNAFKFRLNCIDHYQATPSTLDITLPGSDGVEDARHGATVPIIRIFGATETGQKVCAHLHGAFPYLFVEYQGSLEQSDVNAFIQTFAASVNHALAYSYRRNAYQGSLTSYVAHITLVKGVPFYGFHVGYRYYLKIYLRNPAHMTRFADLLHQGAILGRVTQPYESHLQYLLQWMCDYNLYGCAIIACKQVFFRQPVPSVANAGAEGHRWHHESIASSNVLDGLDFPRQSHCSLEVDIHLQDILNRHEVHARPIHQNFEERLLSFTSAQKYVPSMAGLWRDETNRRRLRHGIHGATGTSFPPDVLVSMSADTRDSKSDWVHEKTYHEMVRQIVAEERAMGGEKASFENFDLLCLEKTSVQSVLESVCDLYSDNISSTAFCLTRLTQHERAAVTAQDPARPLVDRGSIVNLESTEVHDYFSDDQYVDDELSSDDEMLASDVFKNGLAIDQTNAPTGDPQGQGFSQDFLPPTPTPRMSGLQRRSHMHAEGAHPSPSISNRSSARVAGINDISRGHSIPSSMQANGEQYVSHNYVSSTSGHAVSAPIGENASLSASKSGEQRAMVQSEEIRRTDSAEHGVSEDRATTKFEQTRKIIENGEQEQQYNDFVKNAYVAYVARFCLPQIKLKIRAKPPLSKHIAQLLSGSRQPTILYQDAYYSNENDMEKQVTIEKHLGTHQAMDSVLGDFSRKSKQFDAVSRYEEDPFDSSIAIKDSLCRVWKLARPPPSRQRVRRWVSRRALAERSNARHNLKAERQKHIPKSDRKHNLKRPVKHKSDSIIETQYMSVMSLEIFVCARQALVPDPAEDEIRCVFWSVQSETGSSEDEYSNGIIMVATANMSEGQSRGFKGALIDVEETELELINRLVDVVRDLDPDILVGYEVHNGSWGYLIERSRLKYEFDLCNDLSRVNFGSRGRFGKDADRWGFTHTSTIRITGRHMMNIWRAMRGEMNLLQYTIENVAYRLLRIRVPHYSFRTLTEWYCSNKPRLLERVLSYFLYRVQLNLKIFQGVDMVAKTSEQARLLGVDFFSVISRGSQFKVESLMFRIAKPENYVLISPSRKQVGQQNALECLPLVMEPRSNFYPSPMLVLDFQSLYPSIMIAYNYCYSTCLGRIASWRGKNKLGVVDYQRQPGMMELLEQDLSIAPNGLVFVRPHIRKSLLAKMLTEILETRIMVKSGMKQDKKDKILQRLLNNRQLALKLIANVTYGYTSASFSGRLPCAEIADSIVQSGRETLEKAIALIHSVESWGAEVVYGDTDSLFVYLKGKSREEAFTLGKEIADAITKQNPRPIKLKFEKVYHPCVLLAKKRYVGFKYEALAQKIPEFDAKGIETVRRDGTPAEQRIEEKALRILFRTQDLSKVRKYFQEQCFNIMTGNINIQDFLFAKEVKLGTYSDKGPGPPGALIATRKMLEDRRLEPQYGERVPYVVVAGAPGARLIDRCVDPDILLHDDQMELDAEYYISKNIIPPLERIFNLVGANVKGWFDEMPKIQHLRTLQNIDPALLRTVDVDVRYASRRTLETYMREKACLICSELFLDQELSSDEELSASDDSSCPKSSSTNDTSADETAQTRTSQTRTSRQALALKGIVCEHCISSTDISMFTMQRQLSNMQKEVQAVHNVCRDCSGLAPGETVECDSRDCPIFFVRVKETSMMRSTTHKLQLLRRRLL